MSGPARVSSTWRARFATLFDSDLFYSFRSSKVAVAAAVLTLVMVGGAFLAPLIAPHDPYDLRSLELIDADKPPAWVAGGEARYLLGTDDQGRDIFSTMLYGTRASLLIGAASVLLAMAIGLTLGLVAGYAGGRIDSLIMRIADVQLTFPAILTALLIDGMAIAIFKNYRMDGGRFGVLIVAIGLSYWVQYARTVRGVTLVERNKEYVEAARLIGIGPIKIMFQHILPNVMGPVLVIATINLALAIITEATLSFLGVGLPPTGALARHHDPDRQQISVLRLLVDGGVSGPDAGPAGAGGEPARRLAARCAQPQAQVV